MIDVKVLRGALKRKKRPQVVNVADNPCHFRLTDINKSKDSDYQESFIGVFTNKTPVGRLINEIEFQEDINSANTL